MYQRTLRFNPRKKFTGSIAKACLEQNSVFQNDKNISVLHLEIPGLLSLIDNISAPVLHEYNTTITIANVFIDAYLVDRYAGINPMEYFDGYFDVDSEEPDLVDGYADFCYGEICCNYELVFKFIEQWAPELLGINELSGSCYAFVSSAPKSPMPKYAEHDASLRAEWQFASGGAAVTIYMEAYE